MVEGDGVSRSRRRHLSDRVESLGFVDVLCYVRVRVVFQVVCWKHGRQTRELTRLFTGAKKRAWKRCNDLIPLGAIIDCENS